DVVVVHGGRLGEDLFIRHRRQQLGLGDEPGPLFAEVGALLPEVRHQLAQSRGCGFETGFGWGRQFLYVTHRTPPVCDIRAVWRITPANSASVPALPHP